MKTGIVLAIIANDLTRRQCRENPRNVTWAARHHSGGNAPVLAKARRGEAADR